MQGAFLGEAASVLIPNQRIDRILKYVNSLEARINTLPHDVIVHLKTDEEFIDLIEEGFIQASRARSDERREYIVNIVFNGIPNDTVNSSDAKYILGLLAEINDIEVVWLRYFYEQTAYDRDTFRELHANILTPAVTHFGSSKEEFQRNALQESYKDHLERLRLIKYDIKVDRRSGMPEFDKRTGKPKTSAAQVTRLGKMLLEHIGLIDKKN